MCVRISVMDTEYWMDYRYALVNVLCACFLGLGSESCLYLWWRMWWDQEEGESWYLLSTVGVVPGKALTKMRNEGEVA